MKERPILFSAPMVRAILDGRKTQTRRVIKPQPVQEEWLSRCPYGVPGDRLWVKETFGWVKGNGRRTVFRADGDPVRHDGSTIDGMKWKPSIFMPRHESRLTLEVTDVRVERVQDISEADARAEGVERCGGFMSLAGCWTNYGSDGPSCETAKDSFRTLWDSINGGPRKCWDDNPWVWVVGFKVVGQ